VPPHENLVAARDKSTDALYRAARNIGLKKKLVRHINRYTDEN
jgi:hypothetical protein